MERKYLKNLENWYNDPFRKPMLIYGARQVGKTSIVEEFGKNEYDSFIEINFIKRPDLKSIFLGSKDPANVYSRISLLMPEEKIVPGKTLLFLDEIQKCGDARTAIKFLATDFTCDVIYAVYPDMPAATSLFPAARLSAAG